MDGRALREAASLGEMLVAAWRGAPPAADGSWTRVPCWRAGLYGIVAFTGHAALCVPDGVVDETLARLGVDGYGGAHDPRVIAGLAGLAGADGWIDVLDVVMIAAGHRDHPQELLVPRPDLARHTRAALASRLRDDVRVYGYPSCDDALVTVSRGLAGFAEISFELEPGARGRGRGHQIVRAAQRLVPQGQPVVACVSPGNIASLRTVMAAGFEPVASVQLFRPAAWWARGS